MNVDAKENWSWDELLDEYFFSKNLRPATEESYRKVVNVLRQFCRGKTPEDITHKDVLLWRRELLKEKQRSAQTWNNKVAHMRALYNFWISQGYISMDKNPFNNSTVQRETKKKKTLSRIQLTRVYLVMQQLSEDERKYCIRYTWNNAMSPAWYWLVVLDTLRYTGMRLNQLLHVRLRDINLDEGYINLMLEGSKTHREWRVPAVNQLRQGLAYLLEQAEKRGIKPSEKLFDVSRYVEVAERSKNESSSKKRQQKVRSFFRRLSRECGFTVSPHRFRHTLATELMKAPERNLQLVKDLLGHRSVNTTMEYVELQMDIVGKTLEQELSLHTDKSTVRECGY
ncbi:tyrosine-type recombinase/integrase [Mixta tenebrionis]|uniref:Tyrosine recombinase XerD n=2 Tax=Mixta TaxID=2100764 RepID=A0A6P1Q2G2_9GAMM|nr:MULTISPECIES: site-specific integrase [Mixta]QHM72611.1 Tyrosine recombinase XerD [Mixta intestinalis]TPW38354.1 site-specific integrase [Mixta tenebrionis]